jgi:formylglycine-generating enzyme required for sulfatase activity
MLQSGLAWLAAGRATASEDKSPEGMVHIPASEFTMGSPHAEASGPGSRGGRGRGSRADNRHTVRLSEFYIGKYLVTNAEYKLFCDEAASRYRPGGNRRQSGGSYRDNPQFDWTEKANHPVLFVAYDQAMAYCKWVSGKPGWNVTLPSEAQWVLTGPAARAFNVEVVLHDSQLALAYACGTGSGVVIAER